MRTETDPALDRGRARRGAAVQALYIALRGHEPLRLPSRHVVDGIDAISFGRGPDAVTRERRDGLQRLVVRVSDPLMSADHGQLVHARGAWVLEDPRSRNQVIVGGVRTRSGVVAEEQLFSLGQTLCFLASEDAASHRPLDLAGADLPAPAPGLATFDPGFAAHLERLALVAPKELPILLLGETGTGKEVVARALHQLSGRRGAFVAVNCGGISPAIFEAELFGHRRGAFTGAVADREGYVRAAHQGTLFLDEVGELPPSAQTALLRVLQEREVVAVGDALPTPVDLRVCAATNRDLRALIAEGRFREDLYSRLAGLTLELPPLRARRADLGLLIPALLRRRAGAERVRFTWEAATALFAYAWPRNIRELDRALEVMAALAGAAPIGLPHLPDELRQPPAPARARGVGPPAAAREPLKPEEQALKEQLQHLLHEQGHGVAEVARRLGKDRRQIYRWMHRFGIAPGEGAPPESSS